MKKFLASLLAIFGLSTATQPQPKVQQMDPKALLFSVPTLSDDIAPLVPVTERSAADIVMHEDFWSQIEFLPKSQLAETKRILSEYKVFEQANRAPVGWRNCYIRKIQRIPVLSGDKSVDRLGALLGAKAGPGLIVYSSPDSGGRVENGFTFSLPGSVALYGYHAGPDIKVLGATLGPDAEDFKLAEVFMKLNQSDDLILVDWRRQTLLVSVNSPGDIEVWHP